MILLGYILNKVRGYTDGISVSKKVYEAISRQFPFLTYRGLFKVEEQGYSHRGRDCRCYYWVYSHNL